MKWAVLGAFLLSGCAYVAEPVTGDKDGITVKAGKYANPGPDATKHCAQFGKSAVMVGQDGGYFRFACK